MERSKTLALTTQIFNKLTSKTFISKTCQSHPACLPLYICTNCINKQPNLCSLCQQCFKVHECDNKTRGEVGQWVSEQQQKLGKIVNLIQKQFEASKRNLQSCKLKINHELGYKSITEVNHEIVNRISRRADKSHKLVEEHCIQPIIEGPIALLADNFISLIRSNLSGLTGQLKQIKDLVQFCNKLHQQTLQRIKTEQEQVSIKCHKFYFEIMKQSLDDVLKQMFLRDQYKEESKESINKIQLETKITTLQKQIKIARQKNVQLENLIQKIEIAHKQKYEAFQSKQINYCQSLKSIQKQLERYKSKSNQLDEKLKNYLKNHNKNTQSDLQIRKLSEKCKMYEQKLAESARSSLGQPQFSEQRYDMEDMALKLTQLSNQYQNLVVECNNKDKKMAQLSVQINKLQLKNRQKQAGRIQVATQTVPQATSAGSQSGSGRKQFRSP